MTEHYYSGKLNSYLTCVFMNASFVQPNEGPEKRDAFRRQYLSAHRATADPAVRGMRCVFSGGDATSPLVRTHLPLFSGEGVMNFRPDGCTFVPAAGPFVTALMFLPMASRKSEGRLLAVHADDPRLTLSFAQRYLEDNKRLLALPLPSGKAAVHPGYEREQPAWDANKKAYKFANVSGPRSFIMSDLTAMAAEAYADDFDRPATLTAYLLSSSGQGPSLEMFHVPSGVVRFVINAAQPSTVGAWNAVGSRFRPLREKDAPSGPSAKKRNAKENGATVPGRAGWTKNDAFEDLCHVFDAGFTDRGLAASWLRAYLLGRADERDSRKLRAAVRSWPLAALFLREVLGMKQGRIDAIKAFADKLASVIHRNRDKRLLNALLYERVSELQHALRRVQRESAAGDLLFGLDEYRNVWLHEDGDVYLVRDLVSIRVIEELHRLGYFKAHPDDALEGDAPAPATEEARV